MLRRAILLGLLQGPTEMAPVSSSAHVSLARDAFGGEWDDPAQAKGFDVALHGGTAAALSIAMSARLRRSWGRLGGDGPRRRLTILALSLAPPTVAGYLLERPIERRLGGRCATAAGLTLGAAAMALADAAPAERTLEQAGACDGLALGLAQASALVPGVSRRGATLAAARMRGFSRTDADALSWLTALPVIAGACALKGFRLIRAAPLPPERRAALIAGAGAAFASTLGSDALAEGSGLGRAPLRPFAAYRTLLALALVRRRRSA